MRYRSREAEQTIPTTQSDDLNDSLPWSDRSESQLLVCQILRLKTRNRRAASAEAAVEGRSKED